MDEMTNPASRSDSYRTLIADYTKTKFEIVIRELEFQGSYL